MIKFSEWLIKTEAVLSRPVEAINVHLYPDDTLGLIYVDETGAKKVSSTIRSMKNMNVGAAGKGKVVYEIQTDNTRYLVSMDPVLAKKIEIMFNNYMKRVQGT